MGQTLRMCSVTFMYTLEVIFHSLLIRSALNRIPNILDPGSRYNTFLKFQSGTTRRTLEIRASSANRQSWDKLWLWDMRSSLWDCELWTYANRPFRRSVLASSQRQASKPPKSPKAPGSGSITPDLKISSHYYDHYYQYYFLSLSSLLLYILFLMIYYHYNMHVCI